MEEDGVTAVLRDDRALQIAGAESDIDDKIMRDPFVIEERLHV